MLFSSFTFLFWFLPATLLLYFLLPRLAGTLRGKKIEPIRWLPYRNAVLLLASLFFYAWGEPTHVLLLLATGWVVWIFGLWIAKARHPRVPLLLAVSFLLSLLFYFKYAAPLAGFLGLPLSPPRMPLGISFYTFQALSYVADVYLHRVPPEQSLVVFGTYISLFPQLISGPIVKYDDLSDALHRRHHTVTDAAAGTRRFVAGLAKKTLLANPAGALFHTLAALPRAELSAAGAWLALLAFSLQLYYDFSGYSDMAIGLGRLFSFRFPENFNYPYIADSITDFWRRWHITLSTFFKEYVYIPLGGNRRGVFRTVLNLLAVWLLTGLWHGAAWNFLLWGLYYFLLLTAEKFLLRGVLTHISRPVRHLLTLAAILFGWLLFSFDGSESYLTLPALGSFAQCLAGQNGLLSGNDLYEWTRHLPFLLVAAVGATPLPRRIYHRIVSRREALAVVLPLLGLILSIAYLSDAAFRPFLYFRF